MTLEFLKDIIEEQFNNDVNTQTFGFTFKLFAEIGDYEDAYKHQDLLKINGIMIETSGDYTPVKEVSSKFSNIRMQFAVAQENVDKFKIILESWSKKQLGIVYTEESTGDTYILTPGAPTTGTAFNTCELGSTVPIDLVLAVQQTTLGLIGNEATWKINENEVNVLRFQIISARTQQTSSKTNEDETSSANQLATMTIMLVVPVAKTTICKDLYNDILNNNKDAVYSIEMSDNWSDGIDADFVLANGEISAESTKIQAMTLTFLKSNEDLE